MSVLASFQERLFALSTAQTQASAAPSAGLPQLQLDDAHVELHAFLLSLDAPDSAPLVRALYAQRLQADRDLAVAPRVDVALCAAVADATLRDAELCDTSVFECAGLPASLWPSGVRPLFEAAADVSIDALLDQLSCAPVAPPVIQQLHQLQHPQPQPQQPQQPQQQPQSRVTSTAPPVLTQKPQKRQAFYGFVGGAATPAAAATTIPTPSAHVDEEGARRMSRAQMKRMEDARLEAEERAAAVAAARATAALAAQAPPPPPQTAALDEFKTAGHLLRSDPKNQNRRALQSNDGNENQASTSNNGKRKLQTPFRSDDNGNKRGGGGGGGGNGDDGTKKKAGENPALDALLQVRVFLFFFFFPGRPSKRLEHYPVALAESGLPRFYAV
jgi:hypothetical protein